MGGLAKRTTAAGLVAGAAAVLSLAGCTSGASAPGTAAAPPPAPPAYDYVLLLDRSDGPQDKAGSACDTLQRLATIVTTKVSERNDARSLLQAHASGTREMIGTLTLLEPARRGKVRPPPPRGGIEDSVEKHEKAVAKWEEERRQIEGAWQSLPGKLAETCRAKAGAVAYSPLFATLRSGLGECRKTKDLSCQVIFVTDLQENAESSICFAIWGKNKGCGDAKAARAPLPEPLDAQGAKVRICGLTQSHDAKGRLDTATLARVKDVWSKLVVNHSELTMEETCGNLPIE